MSADRAEPRVPPRPPSLRRAPALLRALARFFAPDPALPTTDSPELHDRRFRAWRWSALLSITLGYGFFYTTRLSLSVAKKPLIDEGVLDAAQQGQIGFGLLLAYAFGRFTNGFLADRVNLRRFFATGLLLSSFANIAFGLTSSFGLFLTIWTLNGWVQSLGSPVAGVVMAHWYTRGERGTVYSVWSMAHNIGEGLTFVLTAVLVGHAGWRWGFVGPGLTCLVVALVLYRTAVDRPESKGLRPPEPAHGTPRLAVDDGPEGIWPMQLEVLRNPWIWALGLASALMYVVRYAINDWGVLFLQIEKGYDLEAAGALVSLFPIIGLGGTLLSGIASDRLFGGRRAPVTLAYGLLLIASVAGLSFAPRGAPWLLAVAMGAAGFAIGGLLVFLGGLAALDLCSPRVAGAAMGFVGGLSYVGAALQDWVSGSLLESTRRIVEGAVVYDFGAVKGLWLGASILSLLLASTLWLAERDHRR